MNVAENLAVIQRKIDEACERSGRAPDSVRLVAVSKGHAPEMVKAALDAGLTLFGESKVQEAKIKIPSCPPRAHWHMIGHLQSNKCRDAVQLFEMIESVDSLDLASELNKWADKRARNVPILLEVNIAGESSKFGFNPARLIDQLSEINALPRLEIHGLMTIAPWTQEMEKVRPLFRKLRELKATCEQKLGAPLPELSMGMSGDYPVAIEEGATLIRIGTALFGPRRMFRRMEPEGGDGDDL